MHKSTRRLLSAVLALCLALTLASGAFAAGEAAVITVSGFTPPQPGFHPDIAYAKVSSGTLLPETRWQDIETNASLTASDTFEAGHRYVLRVYLAPPAGQSWPASADSKYFSSLSVVFRPVFGSEQTYESPMLSYGSDGKSVLGASAVFTCPDEPYPVILGQSGGVTVGAGAEVAFECYPDGDSPWLKFRWQAVRSGTVFELKNGLFGTESYTGIDSPYLVISNCCTEMNGVSFQCVVYTSAGSVTSAPALLTIDKKLPAITAQPDFAFVNPGKNAVFSCAAVGPGEVSYKWQASPDGKTWKDIQDHLFGREAYSGADTPTLSVIGVDACLAGVSFRCTASVSTGSVSSKPVSVIIFGYESPGHPFKDVPETEWYGGIYGCVAHAYQMKLINGQTATTFAPNDDLTYAEAVKLAACMNQLYTQGNITLQNGNPWYWTYMRYCMDNGIINAEISLKADEPITREEFAEIFYRAYPAGYFTEINSVADNAIPDVKSGNAHSEAIYALYRAGILTGSDGKGTFDPKTNIKRCEVAAVLERCVSPGFRREITLPAK